MSEKNVIHIAGPIEDGSFQGCANCRTALIDYRSARVMSMDGKPPSFWTEGARVAVRGSSSYRVPERALDSDEELCNEDAFGVALPVQEPSIEQMISELKLAGWSRKGSTWKSPGGARFFGPYGAWKVMRSLQV
jgi:hypothetical protein